MDEVIGKLIDSLVGSGVPLGKSWQVFASVATCW